MEQNIYQKLQQIRVNFNNKEIKKSGRNDYAKFDYFELGDFIPEANKEFLNAGLCPIFSVYGEKKKVMEESGEVVEVESGYATLTIYQDTNSYITFTSPTAEVRMGKKDENRNPIQELGGLHTYLRRYLYINCLELCTNDEIDANIGKDSADKEVRKATQKQIELIKTMYQEHDKLLEHYKVDTFDELSIKQASELIEKGRKRENEKQ